MEITTVVCNVIGSILCVLIATILMLYRRGENKHNYTLAFITWVFINAFIYSAIWLLSNGIHCTTLSITSVILLSYIAYALTRARGNIRVLMGMLHHD